MMNERLLDAVILREAIRSNDARRATELLFRAHTLLPDPYFLGCPLALAASVGDTKLFEVILESMRNRYARDVGEAVELALIISIQRSRFTVIQKILRIIEYAGIGPCSARPALEAIRQDDEKTFQLLANSCMPTMAVSDETAFSFMFEARRNNAERCLEKLENLGYRDDPFSAVLLEDESLIQMTIRRSTSLNDFRWLSYDAIPYVTGCRPIHFAVSEGLLDSAQVLARIGGPATGLDDNGVSVHCMDLLEGYPVCSGVVPEGEVFKLLSGLSNSGQRADLDMALCLAALAGDVLRIGDLVEWGADPNASFHNSRHWTALGVSSFHEELSGLELLLCLGADVERDDFTHSPIWSAIEALRPKSLSLMLERGGILGGDLYLNLAARMAGDPVLKAEILEILLSSGVDVNARDSTQFRFSALHQIAIYPHFDVENSLRILVSHGADPRVRDAVFDATPLEWLSARFYPETPPSNLRKLLGY